MSTSGRRRGPILATLAICIAVVMTRPAGATASALSGPVSSQVALTADALQYAAMHGGTLADAVNELDLEAAAGALEGDLRITLPSTFAGLWVEHKPEFRVVVVLTDYDPKFLATYVNGGPLDGLVELRTASTSLEVLHATAVSLPGNLDSVPFDVWIDGLTRSITGRKFWANQAIGATVCKYGRSTGYDCGEIVAKKIAPGYIPSADPTFIRVHRDQVDLSSGGDSGGPFFLVGDAWGTMSGRIDPGNGFDDAIYMAEDYIEIGLNVTVKTQ